jgi:homoserine dehydrogenase
MESINVRIGIMGLGNVGQAVARLCSAARGVLNRRGVDVDVIGVLERDTERPREFLPRGAKLSSDFKSFFEAEYDLIIEVLGGVNPAFDFVSQALKRGIPVVTPNKALMAAHGVELFQLADENNTALRCEAAALAGVPFLSALRDRPLVARVAEISGIFNGTSNYILSSMQHDKVSFDQALADAQERGYAEPDPTKDVELIDAAEKLVVILQHLGIGGVRSDSLDRTGIRQLKVLDFVQAEALGGTIKPVACGKIEGDKIKAFICPTFVPRHHPIAGIQYVLNAVRLRSSEIGDLVFSGPGAGRDVTAGTILDDVVQIVTADSRLKPPTVCFGTHEYSVSSPATGWFMRSELSENGGDEAVVSKLAALGVSVSHSLSSEQDEQTTVHVLTHPRERQVIDPAIAKLDAELGSKTTAFRAMLEK